MNEMRFTYSFQCKPTLYFGWDTLESPEIFHLDDDWYFLVDGVKTNCIETTGSKDLGTFGFSSDGCETMLYVVSCVPDGTEFIEDVEIVLKTKGAVDQTLMEFYYSVWEDEDHVLKVEPPFLLPK